MLAYIPSKTPEQIALKLKELGVLTSEALFEHFPHLEDAETTKKASTKKSSSSESEVSGLLVKLEELNRTQWAPISSSNPDWEKNTLRWDSFLQWIQEQFGEAILNKQFSEVYNFVFSHPSDIDSWKHLKLKGRTCILAWIHTSSYAGMWDRMH